MISATQATHTDKEAASPIPPHLITALLARLARRLSRPSSAATMISSAGPRKSSMELTIYRQDRMEKNWHPWARIPARQRRPTAGKMRSGYDWAQLRYSGNIIAKGRRNLTAADTASARDRCRGSLPCDRFLR